MVGIPGSPLGDGVLASLFLMAPPALFVFMVAVIVRREPLHRRTGWWLVGAVSAAAVGDGFVAMHASGSLPSLPALAAVLWAVAGFGAATAAEHEAPDAEESPEPADDATGA